LAFHIVGRELLWTNPVPPGTLIEL
jgi:hypothetical protein